MKRMTTARSEQHVAAIRRSAARAGAGPATRPRRASPLVDLLTHREVEVVAGLVRGLTNKQIGHELDISHRTVEIHRARLMRKLGAATLAGLLGIVLPQRARIDALIAEQGRART
jgi:FixJ family two-component response regulator